MQREKERCGFVLYMTVGSLNDSTALGMSNGFH
jgi:hypothetical protein